MTAEIDNDDTAKLEALTAVIVAKVLDEIAPNSETITVSNFELGALACIIAGSRLRSGAKRGGRIVRLSPDRILMGPPRGAGAVG